jgi:hypothetical protein
VSRRPRARPILCLRDGTLALAVNPGPTPLRFPLTVRVSRDEGKSWSSPRLLGDRPEKKPGWSSATLHLWSCRMAAVWTQIKNSPGELYVAILAARFQVHRGVGSRQTATATRGDHQEPCPAIGCRTGSFGDSAVSRKCGFIAPSFTLIAKKRARRGANLFLFPPSRTAPTHGGGTRWEGEDLGGRRLRRSTEAETPSILR